MDGVGEDSDGLGECVEEEVESNQGLSAKFASLSVCYATVLQNPLQHS